MCVCLCVSDHEPPSGALHDESRKGDEVTDTIVTHASIQIDSDTPAADQKRDHEHLHKQTERIKREERCA